MTCSRSLASQWQLQLNQAYDLDQYCSFHPICHCTAYPDIMSLYTGLLPYHSFMFILIWASVSPMSNQCLSMTGKWRKLVQSFSSLLSTLKILGPAPKLLDRSFPHPPPTVNTGTIFSVNREYQTKLQSRLQNCYLQFPSLPVCSKIGSFCWLYKYKTEPTTAWKSHGKVYHPF